MRVTSSHRVATTRALCCMGVMVLVSGCGKPSPQTEIRAYEERPRREPRDPSLRLEEYVRDGMPSPDHVWSSGEMAKAASVLAAITAESAICLPRFESTRSGAIFARIVSPENLSPILDEKIPLASRRANALKYYLASSRFYDIYFDAYAKHAVTGRELVEMMGLEFRALGATIKLANEFIQTLNKKDPMYQARIAAHEKAKRSGAALVMEGLSLFDKVYQLRDSEKARLVECAEEILPSLLLRLAPESRSKILERLEKIAENSDSQNLRSGLARLIAAVRGAGQ